MDVTRSAVAGGLANSISTGTNAASQAIAKGLGKDDFTRLLITQIRNQNPLEPMSNTEFVAQLAQFSSLEQLSMVNSNLGQLQLYQDSIYRMQAASLLGQEIKAQGSVLSLSGDSPAQLSYRLEGDASAVKVHIYSGAGELVKTIELPSQPAGEYNAYWDGKNFNGVRQPSGTYAFIVDAVDKLGKPLRSDTFITGKVTGLSFRGGGVSLLVNGLEVPLESLVTVNREG